MDNTSWEDFVEYMKNAISDPGNRNIDSITRYEQAAQRVGQSVQAFVSYIDSIEDDLGYAGDKRSTNQLLAKLRPEIRSEINRQGDMPSTREKLISTTIRIENHLKMFDGGRYNKAPTGRREK